MASSHQKLPRTLNWSNPPPEILSTITKRLKNGIDIFRCRSVCKNWRASINPNPNFSCLSSLIPRKLPNSTLPFHTRPNDTLLLVACSVLLVKPLPSSNDSSSWVLTVEEVIPGKIRILNPLSKDRVTGLPSNFPKCLNLLDFSVSEIARNYGLKYASDWENVLGVHKVVLCSDSSAMVLYGEGTLIGLKLKNGVWGFVRGSLITSFSDVINYKGMFCAVDYKGNFHTVDHNTMKVIKTKNACGVTKSTQKRLVEREGELLLVTWLPSSNGSSSMQNPFSVHALNKLQAEWVKTSMQGWVMFVSLDWCFIICNRDLYIYDDMPKIQRSYGDRGSPIWNVMNENYLVYSQNCFDYCSVDLRNNTQLFDGASVKLSIGCIFFSYLTQSRVDYICSTIAGALWPPPTWFLPDIFISISDDEEIKDSISLQQGVSVISNKELPPSLIVAPLIGVASGAQESKISELKMHPTVGDSPLKIQDFNVCASTEVFEGVKIKSNLVHPLQNIWTKYGNILEGITIRSGDLIARSLESLATVVLILQSTSGESLNKIQAEYLSSTLSDLQNMNFKVDWLVPFVENALAVHKSKPLVDSLLDFREAKARAHEMKLKVLDELAKLDEVEEDMKFVFEKIPILESVDLKRSLGEGIC